MGSSSSTTGAKSIAKQNFHCVIRKVECRYTSDEKTMKAVLYDANTYEHFSFVGRNPQKEVRTTGILYGGVSIQHPLGYYFITNHEGKRIKLNCNREINLCTDTKHNRYTIKYIDIDSHELKFEEREIEKGELDLYYYNLFYRLGEYGKRSAEHVIVNYGYKHDGIQGAIKELPSGIVAGVIGAQTGSAMDFICALRFIHLPYIKHNDSQFGCYTSLLYNECPHIPSAPTITIYTYPDIEFSLGIGLNLNSRKSNNDKKAPFSFEFSVKYASIEKKLTKLDKISSESDIESQRASRFYNSIKMLADFFEDAAGLTHSLTNGINAIYGEDNNLIKDVGTVGRVFGKTSSIIRSSSNWLKGSLEINPSLIGTWRYSVSDDLSRIGRYIELELGIGCKGELTLDLIYLCKQAFNKAKKTTTAIAITTSVTTGGLAALPSLLIKFLVDCIADWLIRKFNEGVKLNLVLFGNINFSSFQLKWDTSRDEIFQGNGLALGIKLGIKLIAALEFKTSITLFLSMNAAVNASAEASATLDWRLLLNLKNGNLGVDQKITINPFVIRMEYYVVGGFEIWGYSLNTSKGNVKEWRTKNYEMSPERIQLFDFGDVPSEADVTETSAGNGGGVSGW